MGKKSEHRIKSEEIQKIEKSTKHGNMATRATLTEIWSVTRFIDACCEGCLPDAPNRIAYFARAHRFYKWYSQFCFIQNLPRAEFNVMLEHVRKYFPVVGPIDRNGDADFEILGIILTYDPIGRKSNDQKSYSKPHSRV